MDIISCADCGSLLGVPEGPCDHCGSETRDLAVFETAVGLDSDLKLAERHGPPGQVKPHRETIVRRKWAHDRQQHEEMKLIIDSAADWYEQTWRDEITGEVTFTKKGSLSDPAMHGQSARRSQEGSPNGAGHAAFSAIGHLSVRTAARYGQPGEIKPHAESIDNERRWRHDRQRWELYTQVVDRENDRYEQTWRDEETGEVVFTKSGSLSDPNMHGQSARRGKPK